MANPDGQGAPKPPPNLRVSDDENRECDSCVHFDRGRCKLYSMLPVDGEWVCDSYESNGKGDPDAEYKGKNLKEAEQEAFTRVRAHRRRIRSKPDSSGDSY
jgi:hypothetical protein